MVHPTLANYLSPYFVIIYIPPTLRFYITDFQTSVWEVQQQIRKITLSLQHILERTGDEIIQV